MAGLAPAVEPTVDSEQIEIINQLAKEDVAKKVEDGKLERASNKKDREEENVMVIGGGGKKKKAKRQRQARPEEEPIFNVDF